MKILIPKYLLSQTLFFLIINYNYAQFNGKFNSELNAAGFFFNDFNLKWEPNNNSDTHSLKIKEFRLGFTDLHIENIIDNEEHVARIGISGPKVYMDNLFYNSQIYSSDWITNEKIKRLEQRQAIPKDAIMKIAEAIDLYQIDKNKLPSSLNDLHISKHLNLDLPPFNNYGWSYMLKLPKNIIANTTQIYPIPGSKTIHYNFETKSFQTSLEMDSLYNIPPLEWDYLFNINNISTSFSSKIDLVISKDFSDFSLNMKRGQFKLMKTSFIATPLEKLINQSRIDLPELILETHDLIINGSLNQIPIIHSGKGTFRIRNFEIKIPEGLSNEPEIENYLETLGIWNNALMIRLIYIEINMINEFTGDFILKLQTPFIKIICDGDFSSRQTGTVPEVILHNTTVKINPIAFGVKKWIQKWESKNKKKLNRIGATIILKVDGPLKEPIIRGF